MLENENFSKDVKDRISKKNKVSKNLFITVDKMEYLKPMLQMMWNPLFTTFAVVFETGTEENHINFSIKGFLNLIRLILEFGMDEICEIVLLNFLKYTNIKEIK